jgi:LysR family cys regulon transcriptional activator
MNLYHLRFIQTAVRHRFNLTATAQACFSSQSAVSRAITELEDELGVAIFMRHGKRLTGLTKPGELVVEHVAVLMRELGNLKRIGEQFRVKDQGNLRLAATHTQVRYVLPDPLARFRQQYPQITISLHQGTPEEVARMLIDEVADIGMATEAVAEYSQLSSLPCYEWQHMLIMPNKHALAKRKKFHLADLVRYPLITYHPSFSGRKDIDAAFAQEKLNPHIALEAMDADVIQTYVQSGLGLGIVSEMAVRQVKYTDLVAHPVGYLFGQQTARLAFKKGVYLPEFVYTLASLINPDITPEQIQGIKK